MNEADLRDDLARWVQDGWLRPLDAAFARFLQEKVPKAPPQAILAATLASHQLGRGHVCLDLAALADDPVFTLAIPLRDAGGLPTPAGAVQGISRQAWLGELDCPDLVGQGEEEEEAAPLVRRAHRLYLRRQWDNERAVRQGVLARVREVVPLAPEPVRALLEALFPSGEGDVWQRLACALALRRRFALITGGPGTGKTSTVVRLIALLQALALQGGLPGRGEAPLRIRLAAPTGKAAARLSESIGQSLERLPWEALPQGERIRDSLPRNVSTLHRLLGARAGSRRFRHDEADPLVLDVLVIDEASMVDLEMMAAVLRALPRGAQLVLLGDKDQLASVEAGAVLGGLCRRADEGHYTPETIAWLRETVGAELPEGFAPENGPSDAPVYVDPEGTALDQAIAMLRQSHRFAAESAIGQLAAAVNRGDAAAARRVLRGTLAGDPDALGEGDRALAAPVPPASETVALLVPQSQEDEALRRLVCGTKESPAGHALYLRDLHERRPPPEAPPAAWDDWARAVLAAYAGFQILCALREGPWGVGEMNRRIAHWLRRQGVLPDEEGWYEGRPVLMTRNAYALGLMNGDVGVTLALPGAEGQAPRLMVAFAAAGGLRWVLPARLPEVETVFALTVHKSQGSEFGHAVLVLPDTPSPLLTRELIYTGITRARSRFTLVDPSGGAMLEAAIARRVLRSSGLEAPLE